MGHTSCLGDCLGEEVSAEGNGTVLGVDGLLLGFSFLHFCERSSDEGLPRTRVCFLVRSDDLGAEPEETTFNGGPPHYFFERISSTKVLLSLN